MSGNGKAKAVRHRIQCLLCMDIFDNDYIKRHTRVHHKDYCNKNRLAPTKPVTQSSSSQRIDSFLAGKIATASTSSVDEPSNKYRRTECSDVARPTNNDVENGTTAEVDTGENENAGKSLLLILIVVRDFFKDVCIL